MRSKQFLIDIINRAADGTPPTPAEAQVLRDAVNILADMSDHLLGRLAETVVPRPDDDDAPGRP